jgi:hypothetical protein
MKFRLKDTFINGFVLSMLLSAIVFGIVFLLNNYVLIYANPNRIAPLRESTLLSIGLFPNIFLISRMSNKGYLKLSRGILTFVFGAVIYMVFVYYLKVF